MRDIDQAKEKYWRKELLINEIKEFERNGTNIGRARTKFGLKTPTAGKELKSLIGGIKGIAKVLMSLSETWTLIVIQKEYQVEMEWQKNLRILRAKEEAKLRPLCKKNIQYTRLSWVEMELNFH